jgi:hypothetical protein
MKLLNTVTVVFGTLLIINIASADGPPVPHQFKGGDPASASQVNENFQELANRIQALADQMVTYDYRDYGTPDNVVSKSFIDSRRINTTPEECTVEMREYTKTPENENTVITVTRSFSGGDLCISSASSWPEDFEYLATAEGVYLRKSTRYDETHTNIMNQIVYNDGLLQRTTSMKVGMTWGDGSTTNYTNNPLVPPEINLPGGNYMENYTLLAIEDVTVPYDGGRGDSQPTTYHTCLRIGRWSFAGNSTARASIHWYCPGIGLVKRMGGSALYELNEVSVN